VFVELEQGLETVFHERVRNELITKEQIGLTESCEDFVNVFARPTYLRQRADYTRATYLVNIFLISERKLKM